MWNEWISKTYVSDVNEEKTELTVSWRENAAPLIIKYRLPVNIYSSKYSKSHPDYV